MRLSNLPFLFTSLRLHLNWRVEVFTFQPRRKSQIKSCLRCRGNPCRLTLRHLRRGIAIDSRRVHILQTHCSKENACKRSKSISTPLVFFSLFFFFFFALCCETTTRPPISIREHSVPSAAQILIQVVPIWCDTLGEAICSPSLLSSTRSSWHAHPANCSTFFTRRRHRFHLGLSRLGEISCLRLADSLSHCDQMYARVGFFSFSFAPPPRCFRCSRFRWIVLRQNTLTHV